MLFINNYTKKIWIKPEDLQSRWLGVGQSARIDGFKPPNWGGDWYKLSTLEPISNTFNTCYGKAILNKNGTLILNDYCYKFIELDSPMLSSKYLYNHLPGRKKDPYSIWKSEPQKGK